MAIRALNQIPAHYQADRLAVPTMPIGNVRLAHTDCPKILRSANVIGRSDEKVAFKQSDLSVSNTENHRRRLDDYQIVKTTFPQTDSA
ncbi:MAG: hypothetical protein ACR2OJ_05275 [Hyphomicrobiales bacterium]